MIGGEFSGFARRMPIVVVAGAIVILAGNVIKNLFGADRAAEWPVALANGAAVPGAVVGTGPGAGPGVWPAAGYGWQAMLNALANMPVHYMATQPAWVWVAGLVLLALASGMIAVFAFIAFSKFRARCQMRCTGEQSTGVGILPEDRT